MVEVGRKVLLVLHVNCTRRCAVIMATSFSMVASDAETYVGIQVVIVIYPKSVRRLLRMTAVSSLPS